MSAKAVRAARVGNDHHAQVSSLATPIPGDPFEDEFRIPVTTYHPNIPPATIGSRGNWAERHADIPNLLADHRSCPSVGRREDIGITVYMPYTASFARDGSVHLTHVRGPQDTTVVSYEPRQGRSFIVGKKSRRFVEFPACLMHAPAPLGRQARLGLFLLGDLRLNTWIIDSGVVVHSVPEGYTALITPLPNHDYPPTYSISQGMAESFARFMGHLKIPVDLHFDNLAADEERIVLRRGTPMIQWIVAKVPRVRLDSVESADPGTPHELIGPLTISPEFVKDARIRKASGRPDQAFGEIERADDFFTIRIPLTHGAFQAYSLLAKQSEASIDELRAAGARDEDIDYLISHGVVYDMGRLSDAALETGANRPDSWILAGAKSAWDEVHACGRYVRWNTSRPSPELQQFLSSSPSPVMTALDLGCGTGAEASFMASCGIATEGLDISPTAIDLARRGATNDHRAAFQAGDVRDLPFADESFDLVTDRATFHHMIGDDDQERYMSEVGRVLRPGGMFLLRGLTDADPVPRYILPSLPNWICNYIRPIQPERVAALLADRFDSVQCRSAELSGDQVAFPGLIVTARRKRTG